MLKDVAEGVTVVGIPARMVMTQKIEDEKFCAYGATLSDMPDPVARSIDALNQQVAALMGRIEELEGDDKSNKVVKLEKASTQENENIKTIAAGVGKS